MLEEFFKLYLYLTLTEYIMNHKLYSQLSDNWPCILHLFF